jgi:predicted PurR-regulated permease PerM
MFFLLIYLIFFFYNLKIISSDSNFLDKLKNLGNYSTPEINKSKEYKIHSFNEDQKKLNHTANEMNFNQSQKKLNKLVNNFYSSKNLNIKKTPKKYNNFNFSKKIFF